MMRRDGNSFGTAPPIALGAAEKLGFSLISVHFSHHDSFFFSARRRLDILGRLWDSAHRSANAASITRRNFRGRALENDDDAQRHPLRRGEVLVILVLFAMPFLFGIQEKDYGPVELERIIIHEGIIP